jgi:uncharacterized protein YndB with AHSA1/START domain
MAELNESRFVYVTYIRTTPEKLWQALTDPQMTRKYWFGFIQETDWKAGSPWKLVAGDGTVTDLGEILEVDPPRRLAIRWRNEFRDELKAEGDSVCTMDIERAEDAVKLTVSHVIGVKDSKLIQAVNGGWPAILSNLKSLLETGELVLPARVR